jgi:coronin-1B/1C/6
MDDSLCTLKGHNKKVGTVNFHPTASSVLATSSPDATVRIWDIEKAEEKICLSGHADMVLSVGWNYDGSLIATTCKDKKLRVFDPRTNKEVHTAESHSGMKGSRLVWLGASNRICTVGFSKSQERQIHIWDGKDWEKPIKEEVIDTSAGVIIPFWDDDSKLLFLAGKGDGNIRYYEFVDEDPNIYYYVTSFGVNTPQRGMASLPKRAVDVSNNEIDLLYKLTPNSIEPISFRVPRKSDQFQEDLFPDCISDEAALTAEEWFGGKDEKPKLLSLKEGFTADKRSQKVFAVSDSAKSTNAKDKEMTMPEAKTKIKDLEAQLAEAQAKIAALEAK